MLNVSSLSTFIAQLNQKKENHVGYCGAREEEIMNTLLHDFSDLDLETSFTVIYENNEIIAALGLDIDTEQKSAEIWGPFIDPNQPNWIDIAHTLWAAAIAKQEIHVHTYHGFYNEKHQYAKQFMNQLHAKEKDKHAILKANHSVYKHELNHCIQEFSLNYYDAFVELHESSFPNTYYNGPNIIERINDQRRLFILTEARNLIGYVYVEGNRECKEGSIEFIAVATNARRKGAGTSLVRTALHFLFYQIGLDEISLCVSAKNEQAIRLYVRAGFQVEHLLDHYVLEQ
ncbi:GNAT family N-acetyltransferase [Caldalkalibacillus mannanilyticus]|uniref:GNAT family N-acetyltransferase n=1 Tax=Caldalkalibacillus mannanilyticus TaxID=1418 RepID=UPI00054D7B94|nr:GNAT family N-acetyltransferase [Caldalkalibacillus mannanilyticus]